MKRSGEHLFSTALLALVCGGSASWFFLTILREVVGYHPALMNLGLIMMGLGMVGLSLLNFRRGKGKQHLGVTVVAVVLVLLSGHLFLQSLGV